MRITILMAAAVLYAGPSAKSEEPKTVVDVSEEDEPLSIRGVFNKVFPCVDVKLLDNVCISPDSESLLEERLNTLKDRMDKMDPDDKKLREELIKEIARGENNKSKLTSQHISQIEVTSLQDLHPPQCIELEKQIEIKRKELKELNSKCALDTAVLEVLRIIHNDGSCDEVLAAGSPDLHACNTAIRKTLWITVDDVANKLKN